MVGVSGSQRPALTLLLPDRTLDGFIQKPVVEK